MAVPGGFAPVLRQAGAAAHPRDQPVRLRAPAWSGLRRRRAPSGGEVDDAVAARLEVMQDLRQRRHRARLDIVQQQDALALGGKALQSEIVYTLRRDRPP